VRHIKIKDILRMVFGKGGDVYKNQFKKIDPYSEIDYNVYESGPTMKEYVENQVRIHHTWKHRFAYPLMYLGKKILGKHMTKKLPDSPQFKNLRIFDKAFEKSLLTWCTVVNVFKGKGDDAVDNDIKACMSGGCIDILVCPVG